MIDALMRLAIRQRALFCCVSVLVALAGLWSLRSLPIDAVPDVTNRQVQINTTAGALGAEEVERRVTFPLEVALSGVPRVTGVRSISQFGLSQVTVVFRDDTDIYFARQLVSERLVSTLEQLPPGSRPEMSPISSGLGEIYYFRLDNPRLSLMERRTLMEWVVKPALKTVPGLADVNIWGGQVRQLQVITDPARLKAYGVGVSALVRAVQNNNENGSGSVIRRGPQQQVVRTLGMLEGAEDLRRVVVGERSSVPILLGDLARVEEGAMLRQGAVTSNGEGEEVYGIALLLLGENGGQVVEGVKQRLAEIESRLPTGSHLPGFLDRSELIHTTLATASHNLLEGGLCVVVLLFLFLLQLRAGLIVSCAIPLSMLMATMGMRYFGISANLMSLGAIDFGLVVDGAVIIVENCVRRLSERREELGRPLTDPERMELIVSASAEVRKATVLGELLILSTYLPILALQGIEGRMFRPMGWTVLLALLAAMLVSFTLIPSLCAYFLRSDREPHHPLLEDWTLRYGRVLRRALQWPRLVMAAALALTLAGGSVALTLGSDFIPDLEEGALAIQVSYPVSISLDEVVRQSGDMEAFLKRKFPRQVARVVTRIGRPEIATDPMLTCQTDVLAELVPGSYRRAELVADVSAAMAQRFPTLDISYTQPIKMRMMELIEGVGIRADLGMKLYGDDHDELVRLAEQIARVTRSVPGSADVQVEITEGLPQLQLKLKRGAMARYGVSVRDIDEVVERLVGSAPVTSINDGRQRYDVVFRLPDEMRNDVSVIGELLVPTAAGPAVPLRELARLESTPGIVQIGRENGKRRIVVQSNVRGRDLGSFVEEVQRRVAAEVKLPTGYLLEYGGTYEKMKSGRARLALVVPLTLLLVFGLLYATFRDARLAGLVFTGVPFAMVGGVLGLWLRGLPVSTSALIGFVALAGVAVLNGMVMLTFIVDQRAAGMELDAAVLRGASTRFRPVLMTAAVASVGFLPMALSTGVGSEVQRPLATVVIAGIATSTALTLLVLPVAYRFIMRKEGDPTRRSRSKDGDVASP